MVPETADIDVAPDRLVRRIEQFPRDLRAHVDRVMLGVASAKADATLAALVDLQVALGRGGRELRSRLLAKAAALLEDAPLAMLRACLDTGLAADDPRAAVPGSCLARPIGDTRLLVRRRDAPVGATDSPLSLARAALAKGDAGTAQWLLEIALEFDPGQHEIGRELLGIYRRGGLHADFRRMHTLLLGTHAPLAPEWRELEYFLASQGVARQP